MRGLIVYESLWGNTEKVARAIAAALSATLQVDVADVDSAPDSVVGYDLLVVGGPTHAFSMTRASTRQNAVSQNGAPSAPDRGIREWLNVLTPTEVAVKAVAFDTRVNAPRLPGSAAKVARQELHSLGFDTSLRQKSFHVHGYEGPLVEGELERAAQWGREVSDAHASHTA
ncbi:flavodoxin domain-containing protein [Leifsonia sp. Root112D2]|uniref:flavodoxin domain-containing protein n=1 Tax=Leifsonia sp. Root112D2 TaxID=1736426 RepID=UPI0006F803AA|nr:flavodoxin domain-containing protein [Leifsonia sp. Root112D2]KQV05034.1 hypothetical protein ASC63_14550 [Leifsonia sp. Root112D2]